MSHVDPLPDDDPLQRRDWVTRRAKALSLLTLDTASWCAGFLIASWARYEFGITPRQCGLALGAAGVCAVIHAAFEQVRFTARGRHPVGSVGEARDLGGTVVLAAAVALAALLPMTERPIPASVPVLGAAVALLLMGAGRVTYRWRRDRDARPARSADRTLIYGVDAASERLARVLLGDPTSGYLPVGLLDDDPDKQGLRVAGLRVLGGRKQLVQAVRDTRAGTVIFSINGSDAALMRDVRSRTLQAGAAFKVLPPVRELLDRPVTADAVRDLQLTDLLGRAQRVAELTVERNGLAGRRVLVTGAGGSIGSELCRQIARCDPGELMMLDRDESALHALQMSLHGRALLDGPELILADIRDGAGIARVIADRRPDIVFHAAALKHLTLLQRHPGEAVKTNIQGTLNVLEACRDVAEFVNISTDKAANPVSVLGYSKRITERLMAHYADRYGAAFLSVRFGNVLSSRGSVLTAFQAQVRAGLPITVTHPDVTRYFMTVQEAVHLVLQAAVLGRGGEALVLDMGEPVRIAEVAQRLAAEASPPPEIVYTGLRPGEKLHEDLFGVDEIDSRPLHPLISHVRVPALAPAELTGLDPYGDPEELIKQLAACCDDDIARLGDAARLSTLPSPR
ncbi:NDP-sugar epimerase, includes UDP-GlcNAc-inverting 4,6-dehydratase FlaA1 and capsular polysaccharide biosynthesis protein EpsC [Micromonospora matsumotoense]|uniref:NDP-sugar epimerase, includes UDP-GlcNAc-inverting 4,6-dehydratase FlaA1 and capsular polysaccharide biosynthesis protein EpsC n=1 Tax=Micromonospora matsumotoense TaxID=121616 RepID=A0A1C5AG58_9ACTN|nr:nucleoside-diphosphate sugar epimerase/dehydratase [Micromonospora matsumotoense]SCF44014.1 NDP-sugar epimerase, includes UDP-GlcNAc-inverting 4,6-dehydratase FlaA1 and capsular polysaccharide biosynthesis protein EpsC [Micromonospora matsumotoense]